jgi:F-type H+-transporting ATPase subunit delta
MKHGRLARRYATALMGIAEEHGEIDRVASDLEAIGALLQASRELRLLLASPVVRERKKQAVFQELLGKQCGRITLSFIQLLIQKRREGILPEVVGQFQILRDEKEGMVTAEVTGAVPLEEGQRRDLLSFLEEHTGKTVRMHYAVDGAIRGGLLVRIGDRVLDASLPRQLERLREQLLGGRIQRTTHA